MATGTTFAAVTEKRLFGTADMRDRLLGHLRTLIQESFEKSFRGGCVYDSALSLVSGGNDAVTISGTSLATDGHGHLLDVATSGFASTLRFQNTAAVQYEVGLHYAEVPSGIQINPRTGLPEFVGWDEQVGESGTPNLVTDNGNGTITFRVNSVTESGVSNAGRKVRVYKNIPGPNATTEAVAIEELTVSWTGSNNEVTTAAAFGQDTVSTTAADYTVVLMGPTIKRNTSLYDVDGYAFLGTVTGGGAGSPPSGYDITDQDVIDMSLSDLADITSRNGTTDRLKIDVKSYSGDVDDPQIMVRDPAGTPVFVVDGNGNVTIEGTTTQEDFVQVNASETITDNFTAGDDAATDSHKIKGTWWHTNNAETANWLQVDGATGRVGIGMAHDSSGAWPLDIAHATRVNNTLRISSVAPQLEFRETGIAVDAGGLWAWYVNNGNVSLRENLAAGGDFSSVYTWILFDRGNNRLGLSKDFVPLIDDTYDLGFTGFEWKDLYIDGTAFIDTLVLSTVAGEGVSQHLYPSGNDTFNIGRGTHRFAAIYLGTIDAYYVDNTSNNAGNEFARHTTNGTTGAYLLNQYSVSSDATITDGFGGKFFYQTQSNNVAIYGWTRRTQDSYCDLFWRLNSPSGFNDQLVLKYDGGIDTRTILPMADDTYALGGVGAYWSEIYVNTLNLGGSLYPAANLTYDMGSSAYRWLRGYFGTVYVGSDDLFNLQLSVGDPVITFDTGDYWVFDRSTNAHTFVTGGVDKIAFGGPGVSFNAYIRPWSTNSFDIGTLTYRWKTLHIGQIDALYNVDSTSGFVMSLEREATTIADATMEIVEYKATTAATIADGFGLVWKYAIETNDVARLYMLRSGADDQCYLQWHLNTAGNTMTKMLTLRWDSTIETRDFRPYSDDTYDLGAESYRWYSIYGNWISLEHTDNNVENSITDFFRRTTSVTNDQLLNTIYKAHTTVDMTTGFGGKNYFYVQDATASVKLAEMRWELLAGGDRNGRVSWGLDNGSGVMIDLLSLQYNGTVLTRHLSPYAAATWWLGTSSLRWLNVFSTGADVSYTDNTTSNYSITWTRAATTVTDLRLIVANLVAKTSAAMADFFGGELDLSLEDDGGQTTPARITWYRASADDQAVITFDLNYTDDTWRTQLGIQYDNTIRTRHILPYADNSYDLGSVSRRFANVYAANTLYGSKIDLAYTDNTAGNAAVQFLRHTTNGTNVSFDVVDYAVTSDVAIVDGFGGYNYYWINGSPVSYTRWFRTNSDDECTLDFALYRVGVGWRTGIRLRYDQKVFAQSFYPFNDDTSDLGGASEEWRNLYIDGTAYIDTLSLSSAVGEGVSTDLVPTANITYSLGGSDYRWSIIWGRSMNMLLVSDTAGTDMINWYRATTTITNEPMDMANFIARTDASSADNFGADWSFWLDPASGLYNVAKFRWTRKGADDQCYLDWYLRTTSDTLSLMMSIQYDFIIRMRNVYPFANNVNNLGTSSYVWQRLYAASIYLSGSTGLNDMAVLYPLDAGAAGGLNLVFQSGQTAYIGAGEGPANVAAGLAETNTENLHLCADGTVSIWQSADSYHVSDRILHASAGLMYIGPGYTSGGAAVLNVGNPLLGAARADMLCVGHTTELGGTATARNKIASFYSDVGTNTAGLGIHSYRHTTGTGWTDSSIRLSLDVDGTLEAGGYIDWRSTGIIFNNHVYPASTYFRSLGSASAVWDKLYVGSIEGRLISTTASLYAANIYHDGDTNNNSLLNVLQLQSLSSGTAEADGHGGYVNYRASGNDVGRWQWVRNGADDQYDFALYTNNGTSLTERMKFEYFGGIVCTYTPQLLNAFSVDCTSVTSDINSLGAVAGQVGQDTSNLSGTRFITGVTGRVYGGGYSGGSHGIRAMHARAYRGSVSTTGDSVRGIEIDVDDVGTGSATVYGVDSRVVNTNDTGNTYAGYFDCTGGTTGYGLYCTCSGASGTNYALLAGSGTKSWVNPHPKDPTKSIVYATVEADRDTAMLRGRAQLISGRVKVVFPEHFAMTASDLPQEPVHVVVTPRSSDSKGIAVVSSDHKGFEAVELQGGDGNYEFDYVVTAARRGYEIHEAIQENEHYIPGEGHQSNFHGDVQEYYDRQSEGLKRIFRSNGLLDSDGKVNETLFKARNWKTGRIKRQEGGS